MTKYVLLSEFYPPTLGGIQSTLELLVQALGNDVTVVAPGVFADRHINRSLFSGRTWPRWWWLVTWLHRARRQGMQTAIFGHFSAAVIAAWLARIPYAVLVHGNDVLTESRRWPAKFFIGRLLRSAAWVGVNSTFVHDIVLRYGVFDVNIVFTHPFTVAERISKLDDHRATSPRLITIARLVPRKNVGAILQVLVELQSKFPALHLDVVGAGPERETLERLSKELHLESIVTFHGAVSEEKKWRLLSSSTMFVMAPTVLSHGVDIEGLGLVYLEAAAAGLPIVASRTGGVSDAVVGGQTGYLVDPHQPSALTQAIEKLLLHPDLARDFGRRGQEHIRREFTDQIRVARFLTKLGDRMPSKIVSVIIPAYQSAATIGATLKSVFSQTYQQREIIVVNDGSTDELHDALKPFGERITIIDQPNHGAPIARNTGFDASHGDFVLFLDADIVMVPTMIAQMVTALATHPRHDFVYSDFTYGWKPFRLHEFTTASLQRLNYIHTSSLMRREAFPRFDPALKKFQDWDLWLTMAEQGKRGLWIPAELFRVQTKRGEIGLSTWLPSLVYELPFIGQGQGNTAVAKYRTAEAVIRRKHKI